MQGLKIRYLWRLSFLTIIAVLLLSFALCSAIFQISNETVVELSEKDRDALEDYFKLMLTESEGGYVLLGVKPVCVEGVYAVLPCTKLNIFQKSSAYRSERLRQGIETWTRLFSSQDGPIQIVYYDQPDSVFPEWQHVVWLNRKAVLEVIESNLSLFQLVLGPQATSKEVLNRLSDRKESFSSVLANHKVLVGIVLGFGTRNCLAQSRREIIGVPPVSVRDF